MRFIAVRLALMVFVLWVIATIMFVMVRLLPGDPTLFFLQEGASPSIIEKQRTLWGLNDPLWQQYIHYLYNMFTFNFGTSFRQMAPVRPIITAKLLNTFAMMLPSFILIVIISVFVGSYVGWKRGSVTERGALFVSLLLHSVPSFFFAILLLLVFSYNLHWFPSGGMRTPGTGTLSFFDTIWSVDFLKHLALPVAAMSLRDSNGPLLVMRTSILENKGEDFIEMLRAEGLSEWRIIWHAGRNAMLPLVTYLAVLLAFFVQGQVLLEIVFSWPGIGREIVDSLNRYDFPVAQAAFFVSAVAVVILNFIIDILYGFLDPRVRYQ